jgi:hypothetical protein
MSLKSAKKEVKSIIEDTLGPEAPMNLLGKIVFSPFIVLMIVVFFVSEILFAKN